VNQLELFNMAISHLGIRAKIAAADEDSVEASACRTHWAGLRDLSLRLHDWNFARVTARLEALADAAGPPLPRWRHRHRLPADCLRLRRLNGRAVGDPARDFCEIAAEREDGAITTVLYSDATPADAIYTARVDDPERWDAGFADAIGWGLAARTCYELTGRDDRARTLMQQWQASLAVAAATAANETAANAPTARSARPMPEVLRARGYRGW
jgi:hypothetical protein